MNTTVTNTENYSMDLPSELLSAIDGIQSTGTFASFGAFPAVDPEIHVHDVGGITLPLDPLQARRLIEKAHQAPYGKGSETIVDTSVRNTWELNPEEHFEFKNPEWNAHLKRCCARVATDLGVHSPVSAELYKMLIYEKGAMFKPHTE